MNETNHDLVTSKFRSSYEEAERTRLSLGVIARRWTELAIQPSGYWNARSRVLRRTNAEARTNEIEFKFEFLVWVLQGEQKRFGQNKSCEVSSCLVLLQ